MIESTSLLDFQNQPNKNYLTTGRWQPQEFSIDERIQKMRKNTLKAYQEFDLTNPKHICFRPSICDSNQLDNPIQLSYNVCEKQGRRNEMEDAHFVLEAEQSLLVGVFDGHGGSDVSKFVSEVFPVEFSQAMKESESNVHYSFEKGFSEVEKKIEKNRSFSKQGSTATICYINKRTSQIFTATLGDSEATIFRNVEGIYQAIPISCVRNWCSDKDYNRVIQHAAKYDHKLKADWKSKKENNDPAKYYRYPVKTGVNISRSFGDLNILNHSCYGPGLSHKPKITLNELKIGDIHIIGCDGLYDYVKVKEIACQLDKKGFHQEFAKNLVKYAIETKSSGDNVSVIAMQIQKSI